jgi:RNA polymerase sigma factor (TIGR02999 family)
VSEVTRILSEIEDGDGQAAEKLLPLIYEELRNLARARMSQEEPGQTLQATALVHEAYIRLVDKRCDQSLENRGHFFAAASEAMRRILVDRARDKGRLKRGGGQRRIDLDKIKTAVDTDAQDLLAVNEAVEQLAEENRVCANVVKMRFFVGLSVDETASLLGISSRTAKRYWVYARAWLYEALCRDEARRE